MTIIPIPTWLLNDAELEDMRRRLIEAETESDSHDPRVEPAVAAIEAELERRGKTITLVR